jgi:hypothetical protein
MRTRVPRLPMGSPPKPEWQTFAMKRKWVRWLRMIAVASVLRTVGVSTSALFKER